MSDDRTREAKIRERVYPACPWQRGTGIPERIRKAVERIIRRNDWWLKRAGHDPTKGR